MRPNLQGVALGFAIHHPRLTLCCCPNTLCLMQTVQPPINLENWIEENRERFKPPVSNRYLYDGRDFFVMVIKGPNARNDFHLVDSEEYFYQLKGDIKVRVREGDRIVDHIVKEGETFFIPPNVPHAPVRPGDARFLEGRSPAYLQEVWNQGAKAGTGETVLGVRALLAPCFSVGHAISIPFDIVRKGTTCA
jgi:quercetin dioxygenase-like cupin family protein